MPMLYVWRTLHHVTFADGLLWLSFYLIKPDTVGIIKIVLPVYMPITSYTGFEINVACLLVINSYPAHFPEK